MAFEEGVKYYTFGTINHFRVAFPENRTTCNFCWYCRHREGMKRYECMLTDEILLYPFDCRGQKCPIELENEGGKE